MPNQYATIYDPNDPTKKMPVPLTNGKYLGGTPAGWSSWSLQQAPTTKGLEIFQGAFDRMPQSDAELAAIEDYNYLEPTGQDLRVIQAKKAQAQQAITSYQPNTLTTFVKAALALKAKPEQEKLGVSTQYEKAGIPLNMATLSGALSLRSQELNNSIETFNATLNSLSGAYRNQYEMALGQYQLIKDDFDSLIGRARDLEDNKTNIEQQLDLYKRKAEIDLEFDRLQAPSYQLKETAEGYAVFDSKSGELIPLDKTGRRTDRNYNPIAVSNAKQEWLDILTANGISYTLEQGADFAGGLKTIKFSDLSTGVEGARVLLGQSDAFYWYKNHTGKAILDQLNVNSPADFARLDRATQDKIISSIYQAENGGGSGLTVTPPKDQEGFWDAINQGIKQLKDGESWGTVWNRIKMQFPETPNETIDNALGTEWREPGAYQKWAASKKVTTTQDDFFDDL